MGLKGAVLRLTTDERRADIEGEAWTEDEATEDGEVDRGVATSDDELEVRIVLLADAIDLIEGRDGGAEDMDELKKRQEQGKVLL